MTAAMYKFHYEEASMDESSRQRGSEREAIEHSIYLLRRAERAGPGTMETVEAVAYVNRLWGFFLEELSRPDNSLPMELRAKLISIGLWIIRETDAIGDEKSRNFAGVIDISQTIAEGLQ